MLLAKGIPASSRSTRWELKLAQPAGSDSLVASAAVGPLAAVVSLGCSITDPSAALARGACAVTRGAGAVPLPGLRNGPSVSSNIGGLILVDGFEGVA